MIQPSPCFWTPFPPGGGDVFFDVGRRCGADAGLNDHCRHRRRRIIITLTVIATGIRTERHGFGWRRHIIPMRRHVLAIYVAVEGAGVGAAIGPAVFPGPCAGPCSLLIVDRTSVV